MTRQDVDTLMNKKSVWVSRVSAAIFAIYAAAGRASAGLLALDIFKYQHKLIGSYAAAMGGVDVVVFTAITRENTADVRMGAVDSHGPSIDPTKRTVGAGSDHFF